MKCSVKVSVSGLSVPVGETFSFPSGRYTEFSHTSTTECRVSLLEHPREQRVRRARVGSFVEQCRHVVADTITPTGVVRKPPRGDTAGAHPA